MLSREKEKNKMTQKSYLRLVKEVRRVESGTEKESIEREDIYDVEGRENPMLCIKRNDFAKYPKPILTFIGRDSEKLGSPESISRITIDLEQISATEEGSLMFERPYEERSFKKNDPDNTLFGWYNAKMIKSYGTHNPSKIQLVDASRSLDGAF